MASKYICTGWWACPVTEELEGWWTTSEMGRSLAYSFVTGYELNCIVLSACVDWNNVCGGRSWSNFTLFQQNSQSFINDPVISSVSVLLHCWYKLVRVESFVLTQYPKMGVLNCNMRKLCVTARVKPVIVVYLCSFWGVCVRGGAWSNDIAKGDSFR